MVEPMHAPAPKRPRLSALVPCYNEQETLAELHRRLGAACADAAGADYEIVLVNDGSPDDSLDIAAALHREDGRVKVVDLSRNFGQHRAAMTGLARARGRLVFQIDVDLEEEPELLTRFHEILQQNPDADVVYGVQERRKGKLFERASGAAFYWLFNFLSPHKIPANLLMARLMTRRYVQALVSHRETELDISSLWQITGFKQVPVTVQKHGKSTTTYTLARKLELSMRSLTFSDRPLLYIGALGLAILTVAALYFAYVMYVFLFVGEVPSGFTSIVLSIWLLGGLIIFSLGVIAVYVSIIFNETKRRPYAIVRDVLPRETDAPS